jgi:hypothetical protein
MAAPCFDKAMRSVSTARVSESGSSHRAAPPPFTSTAHESAAPSFLRVGLEGPSVRSSLFRCHPFVDALNFGPMAARFGGIPKMEARDALNPGANEAQKQGSNFTHLFLTFGTSPGYSQHEAIYRLVLPIGLPAHHAHPHCPLGHATASHARRIRPWGKPLSVVCSPSRISRTPKPLNLA